MQDALDVAVFAAVVVAVPAFPNTSASRSLEPFSFVDLETAGFWKSHLVCKGINTLTLVFITDTLDGMGSAL